MLGCIPIHNCRPRFDAIQIGQGDADLLKTVPKCPPGKGFVIFDPGEALLLHRRNKHAILQKAAR
jgi:hypothetical protein